LRIKKKGEFGEAGGDEDYQPDPGSNTLGFGNRIGGLDAKSQNRIMGLSACNAQAEAGSL
jgi:hypothetical protein